MYNTIKLPWTADTFRKHNHDLIDTQAEKAAAVANAVLKRTGDEASAIRIGNATAMKQAEAGKYAKYRGGGK